MVCQNLCLDRHPPFLQPNTHHELVKSQSLQYVKIPTDKNTSLTTSLYTAKPLYYIQKSKTHTRSLQTYKVAFDLDSSSKPLFDTNLYKLSYSKATALEIQQKETQRRF